MPKGGRAKKYIVRLSTQERETLHALLHKGRHPASQVLKARILLKADVSEAGEGWNDERIVEAFETSAATVYRTRQRLVEEGFEAVLRRKPRERPPIARIFDGEAEARLDPSGLLRTASRAGRLDTAAAGGKGRGTGDRPTGE